jgi:hypothetical protein
MGMLGQRLKNNSIGFPKPNGDKQRTLRGAISFIICTRDMACDSAYIIKKYREGSQRECSPNWT